MKKIFAVGDLHGKPITHLAGKLDGIDHGDVLICLGDFGVFFGRSKSDLDIQKWDLDWFEARPFTTLFIDGNHENFEMLDALPTVQKFGGKAGKVRSNVFHLRRGEIYNIFGKKVFAFGGAVSIDRNQRISGVSWWDRELPTHAEYEHAMVNLDKHDWKVDLVITHTMPNECADEFRGRFKLPHYKLNDPVSTFLTAIREILKYDKWYCGHFHVNADLLDVRCLYTNVEEIWGEKKADGLSPYWARVNGDDDF